MWTHTDHRSPTRAHMATLFSSFYSSSSRSPLCAFGAKAAARRERASAAARRSAVRSAGVASLRVASCTLLSSARSPACRARGEHIGDLLRQPERRRSPSSAPKRLCGSRPQGAAPAKHGASLRLLKRGGGGPAQCSLAQCMYTRLHTRLHTRLGCTRDTTSDRPEPAGPSRAVCSASGRLTEPGFIL